MSDLLFYEDVAVGLSFETGGIVVTESPVVQFAGLSGDFFDPHMDDDFARSLGFEGRVAHGLLGLIFVDGLKNRASHRFASRLASAGAFRSPPSRARLTKGCWTRVEMRFSKSIP